MPNFCEDCKWFGSLDHCVAPQNTERVKPAEFVTREKEPQTHRAKWMCASTQRKMGWFECRLFKSCGREGRWFVWSLEAVKRNIINGGDAAA
jgi:hypothetical protein